MGMVSEAEQEGQRDKNVRLKLASERQPNGEWTDRNSEELVE